MGLDIGFVDSINWKAPRPGWDFFETFQDDIFDGGMEPGQYLSLENVQDAYKIFSEGKDKSDCEDAKAFLDWVTEYWEERDLSPEQSITVIVSY